MVCEFNYLLCAKELCLQVSFLRGENSVDIYYQSVIESSGLPSLAENKLFYKSVNTNGTPRIQTNTCRSIKR